MDNKEVSLPTQITYETPYETDPDYLVSSNKTDIDELNILQNIKEVAEKASKQLEIKTPFVVTVSVPTDTEKGSIIPTMGIGGKAIGTEKAKLFFDPSHTSVVENLAKRQPRQVAHEINHLKRNSEISQENRTLADALISEGLATYYEERFDDIYVPTPWGEALNQEQLSQQWEKAKNELGSSGYDHREWFFGQKDPHPVWTGYSLGKAIVSSYMESHPETQMKDLIKIPSMQIIENSNFEKKQK